MSSNRSSDAGPLVLITDEFMKALRQSTVPGGWRQPCSG
jgi:hypothetical protein